MNETYLIIGSKILGALALLIFGMKIMSEALQKMAGPQLRHVLGAMTTNRWTGLLTGMLITVAVQSSSATTVMTVSFVNAGLLPLAQAISVIMGANIGTTLTAWIMSAGFTMNITDFVWPAFVVGIALMVYWRKYRYFGDFLFGVAFMFFSLATLSVAGKELDLGHNETMVEFFSSFNTSSYGSIFIFLIIGTILTCIVQSSAALMRRIFIGRHVHADHIAFDIDQRSAAVARIYDRIRLQDIGENHMSLIGKAPARPAECADRDGAVQTERISHRNDRFPQIQPAGIIAADGGQSPGRIPDFQESNIMERVVRYDFRFKIPTSVQRDHDFRRTFNDMGISDDQAGRIDYAAAAERITGGTFLGPEEFIEQTLKCTEIIGIRQIFGIDHPLSADIDHSGEGLFNRPDHLIPTVRRGIGSQPDRDIDRGFTPVKV